MISVDNMKQGLGAVQAFTKQGTFKKCVAYMGKPIGLDIKDYEAANPTKEKGALYYPHRYGLTWGNVIGVGGFLLSGLSAKFSTMQEEPNPLLKAVQTLGGLAGVAGIIGSIWGSLGPTFDRFVGNDARIEKLGKEIFEDVCKEIPKEEIMKAHENSPLRFTEDVWKNIKGVDCSKGVKKFFVGIPGTGKTVGMNYLTGEIINYEDSAANGMAKAAASAQAEEDAKGAGGRDVVTLRLAGSALNEAINAKYQSGQDMAEGMKALLSVAPVDADNQEEVSTFFSQTKTKILEGFLLGLQQKYADYAADGKRLVVQLDEIDELFDVARKGGADSPYDEHFLNKISGVLGNIFDDNNNFDIICTSNKPVEDLVGLVPNFEGDMEKLLGSNMAKVYSRLKKMCTEIGAPDYATKARIAHVYLARELKDVAIDKNDPLAKVIGDRSMAAENQGVAPLGQLFVDDYGVTPAELENRRPAVGETFDNEVADVTTAAGIIKLRKQMSNVESLDELEDLQEKVLLKLKLKQLAGRGIEALVQDELVQAYNHTGQPLKLEDVRVAIRKDVEAQVLPNRVVAQVEDIVKGYREKLEEHSIKLLDESLSSGSSDRRRNEAEVNIEHLLDEGVADNVVELLKQTQELNSSVMFRDGMDDERCEALFKSIDEFVETYCSTRSKYMQRTDLKKDDREVSRINGVAGRLLVRLNNALNFDSDSNAA